MSSEQRSNLDELATRTVAMPADTNPSGDIFGGWVLSEMDIAGSIVASKRTKGRTATVGLEAMSFHKPIKVGDIVSNYARVVRVGRTSITVEVITAVERQLSGETIVVTEGLFTYVAVNEKGQPRLIERL
ncbi:MAG: acyl-CoA thioesterase [Alphaproteobacteria bacterium]|jgi:acyl-CoA thioesterase YciA|nr:MAG: putative acyl-CoA thioester hydrolase [Alphaproteobacteria bacterium MarineAlpha9_Bin6]PPR39006.1 MAG: putative acyl-CoA thioester hydrolase [Alphaproteobacteria bacterium MarineAlpha9_Bin5]HHZ68417.1 acyl-CoA thioesterase [Alphaproteobacteria bacterium]HIA21263.1 acyl-CoA thioesterase [Alphaproteobacteria bacterium]HIB19770.1 acyl-CoA thioesterase [Alphaproteobacteria bacterium]